MALLNKDNRRPINPRDIHIDQDVNVDYGKKREWDASDRFSLKANPEAYEVIKSLCQIESKTIYEVIDEITEFYADNIEGQKKQQLDMMRQIVHQSIFDKLGKN